MAASTFTIEQFIPYYPVLGGDSDTVPESIYNNNINQSRDIYFDKYEFNELEHAAEEKEITTVGKPLQRQILLTRLMADVSPIDGLLVYDAVGTGKCVHPNCTVRVIDETNKANCTYYTMQEMWDIFVDKSSIEYEEKKDKNNHLDPGLWGDLRESVKIYSKRNVTIYPQFVSRMFRQYVSEILYVITVKVARLDNPRQIICTGLHKLFRLSTEENMNGWTPSNTLSVGNIVLMCITNSHKDTAKQIIQNGEIISISTKSYTGYVYDFEMNLDHNYIVNDFITHNTCSAVNIAENIMLHRPNMKRTLVLSKNNFIRKNFMNEIAYKCTDGKYIEPSYDPTDISSINKNNALIRKNYEFDTFESFGNQLNKMKPEHIISQYSNRVIILDEVHNIRDQVNFVALADEGKEDLAITNTPLYETIYNFLHIVNNVKIILLTATPMKDQPGEFAQIINLILPVDKQLPIGKKFKQEFFDSQNQIKSKKLGKRIQGYIAYVENNKPTVNIMNEGKYNDDLNLDISIMEMSAHQSKSYITTIPLIEEKEEDDETTITTTTIKRKKTPGSAFSLDSIQASLFVFPDGSFGAKGESTYLIKQKKTTAKRKDVNKINLLDIIRHDGIKKFSIIYYQTIESIKQYPNENVFVFNSLVNGSGANVFGLCLKVSGFEEFNIANKVDIKNMQKANRYVMITGENSEQSEWAIDKIFNHELNKYGEYIRILVGSKAVSEGRSLRNVRQIHIQTPHWNSPEIEQAIGRGVRFQSHTDLPENERHVRIFRPVPIQSELTFTISPDTSFEQRLHQSIAYRMYLASANKDEFMNQVKDIARKYAIDCNLTRARNGNKTCALIPTGELIYDTYNLYYSELSSTMLAIRHLFASQFQYTLSEIYNTLNEHTHYNILLSLDRLIRDNISIINPNGFSSYLRTENDIYFVLDSSRYPSTISIASYMKNILPFEKNTFEHAFTTLQSNFIIENQEQNYGDIQNRFLLFDNNIQDDFMKNAIEINDRESMRIFHNNIEEISPNTYVITLLTTNKKIIYNYEQRKWIDYIEAPRTFVMPRYAKIYGLQTPKGVKIVDRRVDDNKRIKGAVCTTITPIEKIIDIIVALKIPFPSNLPERKTKKEKEDSTLNEWLNRYIDDEDKAAFTKWYKQGFLRLDLCTIIVNWFRDNNHIKSTLDEE
jgi:hypothetical protein